MNCRRHPDRPVSALDMGDGFCTECFIRAWNSGAAWADAHWADTPKGGYELTRDGRAYEPDNVFSMKNLYAKRTPGDTE